MAGATSPYTREAATGQILRSIESRSRIQTFAVWIYCDNWFRHRKIKKCGKNVLIYRSREWPCVSVLSNAAIFTNIKVKIWILLVMREVKQLSPTYLHTHSTGNEPLLLTCETSSTSELHPLSSHSVSQAGFKP